MSEIQWEFAEANCPVLCGPLSFWGELWAPWKGKGQSAVTTTKLLLRGQLSAVERAPVKGQHRATGIHSHRETERDRVTRSRRKTETESRGSEEKRESPAAGRRQGGGAGVGVGRLPTLLPLSPVPLSIESLPCT